MSIVAIGRRNRKVEKQPTCQLHWLRLATPPSQIARNAQFAFAKSSGRAGGRAGQASLLMSLEIVRDGVSNGCCEVKSATDAWLKRVPCRAGRSRTGLRASGLSDETKSPAGRRPGDRQCFDRLLLSNYPPDFAKAPGGAAAP